MGLLRGRGARVHFLGWPALSCTHAGAPAMMPQIGWDVKLILLGGDPCSLAPVDAAKL